LTGSPPWEALRRALEAVEAGGDAALVVFLSVRGSAVLREGQIAVFTGGGLAAGWAGGPCIESALTPAVLEALALGKPLRVRVRLAPGSRWRVERGGGLVSVEGGGDCRVEVEAVVAPVRGPQTVLAAGDARFVRAAAALGGLLGFRVAALTMDGSRVEGAWLNLSSPSEVARLRGLHPVIVVASMGNTDFDVELLRRAAEAEPLRVYLVSGRERARRVAERLKDSIPPWLAERVEAPAGVDIGASTPEELALAVMAGVVAWLNNAPARPASETRGENPFKELVGGRSE